MTIATKAHVVPSETLERWQDIVNLIAELLDVPAAVITRINPPKIAIVRTAQIAGNPYQNDVEVDMAGHYCERVVTAGKPLRVNHAPTDVEWKAAPEIAHGLVAYLGLPLRWPDGDAFGTICVLDNKANAWDSRYDRVLEQFKGMVEAHLALIETAELLRRKNEVLIRALGEVKQLQELLPMCSNCKKIRKDDGYWQKVEDYFLEHDTIISHGLCPQCALEMMPDVFDDEAG